MTDSKDFTVQDKKLSEGLQPTFSGSVRRVNNSFGGERSDIGYTIASSPLAIGSNTLL